MTYGSSSFATVAYASLTGTGSAAPRPFRPPVGTVTLRTEGSTVTSSVGSATFTPTRG
jgi:hypothetical protein